MATEVYMPKNGMDMTEGTIIRWLKNEGDRVEKDQPIMEIETDKITMESESPADGVLLKKGVKASEAANGLKKGVYIIGKKKVLVK